jgi:metallo-beta-lactamase family protein
MSPMQAQFPGAADTMAGSRHPVTAGSQRILLDCGLFQGCKVLRERNWVPQVPLVPLVPLVPQHGQR